MLSLTIDDREVEVEEGATIFEAAEAAGIYVPTFCYHKRLMPFGACRMCVVEVEQMKGRLIPSCSTPATNGMVVRTDTPEIRKARKTLLELLLIHHPLDCPVCDKGGDCKLQDLAYEYEVAEVRFQDRKFSYPIDYHSPLIERNTNRCVLCGMCVRVCDEVVGVSAVSFINRGFNTLVGTNFERVLDCEFCGECVNICPVGALTDKLFKYKARSWELKKVSTICSYCATGCTLTLGVKANKIYRIIGDDRLGVNEGSLCAKGRFGYQYVSNPERMNSPLVRDERGELVRATWEEALGKIGREFIRIRQTFGAESIGGICSDRLTNEEAYSFQKLMRAVVGTNNIDHGGTYSYSALLGGLRRSLGYAGNRLTLRDIRNAEVIFLIRSNLSETHPVIGYQVTMAVKRDEATLIVASDKTIKFSRLATVALNHFPAAEVALINGIIHVLIKEGLWDKGYVTSSVEGFEALKSSVSRYSGEYVEQVTGVERSRIEQVARLLSQKKRVCLLISTGLGIMSDDENFAHALANLALLLGIVDREGSGIAFLGEKCNSQGVLDMGVLPHLLPGYRDVSDEKARKGFEEGWKTTLHHRPGLTALDMIDAASQGKLKALYIVGENPLVTYPDSSHTKQVLESLEFLVVQDMFLTPTARLADVVLPVASFAEKGGTYTNFEGRVQELEIGLTRREGVRTDLEIFKEIAVTMGYEMMATLPERVLQEIGSLVPLYAEVGKVSLKGTGQVVNYSGEKKGKYCFIPVEYDEQLPPADNEFPFLLQTGSVLFHSGTLSTRSPELNHLSPGGWVEIHPDDARMYQLTDGQTVMVWSRRGEIKVKVKLQRKQRKGTIFIPYHFESQPVNLLTDKGLRPTRVALRTG